MFGAHWPELVVFLVVALVIFGPKRLPEIGGALGKGIREFRKGTSEAGEEPAEIHAAGRAGEIQPPADSPASGHASTAAQERDAVHASPPAQE